ncbi:MAG TPA: hypothetical protein VN442_10955 [Bryobacteraceae bacterium]|nr:hypothetical protein [Bryobacteraceae bacterium]
MNRRTFLASGMTPALSAGIAAKAVGYRSGFAERDISPKIGMEKPGGLGPSYHTEFHDPCKVRAAVFDDGNKRVALVGVDTVAIGRYVVQAARKEIERRCGIAPESVLVAASHSHSSGPVARLHPSDYAHASPLMQKLAQERAGDLQYTADVIQQIAAAVTEADRKRVPALCGAGSGREDQVAFNRRHRMKNGLTWTHPGKGNPDMLDYAGPVDPEVGVVGSWDASGKLLGCVVNFACHATTSPRGISANWIYNMEQVIRGAMGPNAIVVFLPGACGDVTQVDNRSPYAERGGENGAAYVGGRIGAEVVKTLLTMHPGVLAPIDARSTLLRLNYRVPSPGRVERSLELVRKDPKAVNAADLGFAKRALLLHALTLKQPYEEVEVQAVQLGGAVFVTNPAELFCRYGLDLKAKSPFPKTFPVELANGWVGYVPTEDAFGPNGGGYETRIGVSRLETAAGTKMVNAGLELARQLKPGVVPERPKAGPFKAPWSYGNVPPELT